MENFDDKNWQKLRAKAPDNMFGQVRERIIKERIQRVKTHRQLTIGAVLLLFVAVLNIGIALSATKRAADNTEQILYETYFDNTISLDNGK